MASMTLEIITGERVLYSGDASSVVIPGLDGELGILPHHAALMTCLQPGEIVVSKETGEDDFYAVSGGFVEVMANKVLYWLILLSDPTRLMKREFGMLCGRLRKELLLNRRTLIWKEQSHPFGDLRHDLRLFSVGDVLTLVHDTHFY